MADLLERDPNIIERESALSDEIKKSFDEQGGILDATADILKNILGVLKGDSDKSDTYDEKDSPIVDGLARLGVGIEETLDGVVGMIVDPIRKGLKAVVKDITGGLDYAMGAGMVVATLEWLWDNWDVAIGKLGDLSTRVWEKFKKDGIPLLIDGFITLGTKIWDNIPESLKGAFEAIRNLSADVLSWGTTGAGWLMRGVEWALRAVGLDDAAVYFGSIADSLSSVADWFDPNSKFTRSQAAEARRWKAMKPEEREKMQEKVKAESLATTLSTAKLSVMKDAIYQTAGMEIMGGSKRLYEYALKQGLDDIRAIHLASIYMSDIVSAPAVSKRFREATGGPDQTRESVLQAYGESRMTSKGAKAWLQEQETTASAIPVTPDVMDGLQGVVEEKAAKVKRDEESNQLLKQLLDETRKSNEEKPDDSAAIAVPMIDARSADGISAFGHGNMAGGIGT